MYNSNSGLVGNTFIILTKEKVNLIAAFYTIVYVIHIFYAVKTKTTFLYVNFLNPANNKKWEFSTPETTFLNVNFFQLKTAFEIGELPLNKDNKSIFGLFTALGCWRVFQCLFEIHG